MVKLLLTGDDFFGVGIRLEFQMFTPTSFQNSICIGLIEVSDGHCKSIPLNVVIDFNYKGE